MEKIIKIALGTGLAAMLATTAANAALVSRMNGEMLYDDVLNITWLTNGNLAESTTFGITGIYSNGTMNWDTANNWVAAMNADNGTGYLGFNNWRMPTMVDTGNPGCDWANVGTDCGFNSDTSSSEFASMYYDTLEIVGSLDADGNAQADAGINAEKALPFYNFKRSHYWFGLEFAPDPDHAWHFDMQNGRQLTYIKTADNAFVIPVIAGDVAAVPVPAAIWLFASGLLGLAAVSRRKGAPTYHA
ncbi:hypothetical protein MNBD_GAMMA25-2291 [hydrothermal vent metagenome]|uniref:DUF1566 domain-containing protein n=1 Tax=hydrothermal vent metagenome TaxID=652676 RepID=A0A3B1B7V1_9ZZZZ